MTGQCEFELGHNECTTVKLPKILVIDDEQCVFDGIRRVLTRHNMEVIAGYHGIHGTWRGMTESPDLIITDMRMPYASGAQVVHWLRRNPGTRDVPIVVLTGLSNPNLEKKMRSLGVVEFFTKPADMEALVNVIYEHV